MEFDSVNPDRQQIEAKTGTRPMTDGQPGTERSERTGRSLGLGGPVLLCAAASAAIAVSVVLGWSFNVGHLKSVLPGAVEMKFNTALGLLAAAFAMWRVSATSTTGLTRGELLAQAAAAGTCALGLLTLVEYVFGADLAIDQMFVADTARAFNVWKGRMSPYTAAALACLGFSELALLRGWPRALWRWPVLFTGGVGIISLIGYAWNASEVTSDAVLPPVAVNTAVALLLLSGGNLVAATGPAFLQGASPSFRISMRSVEAKVLAGFMAALLFLVVAGGLSYRSGVDFANATQWVSHSQQVRTTISQINADVLGAGLANRNYVITGEMQFRVAYREALSRVHDGLRVLQVLVSDSPVQRSNANDLGRLVGVMQDVFARTMSVYDKAGMVAAQKRVAEGAGMAAIGEVSVVLGSMEEAENQLLRDREAASTGFRQRMLMSMLAAVTLAAVIFALLFRNIRDQLQARHAASQQLLQARQAAEAARRDADAANSAKSRFLAAMSHEIRTPMNGVLGLLELLSLGRLDGEQRSTLGVIRQSGQSLLRIVDDILDFSKIEAGRLELHPQPASVAEVVQRVCRVFSGAASTKGLLLQTHIDPRVAPAHLLDQLRLEQVLGNFVSNAVKFTERGSVELSVQLAGREGTRETLCFTVRDSGVGIAADKLGRLFEPFTQADAQTSSRYGGTGLGLTISRRIAELMGGAAGIESVAGVGTTATLTVTLEIADLTALPSRTPDTSDPAKVVLEGRRQPPSVEVAEAEGSLLLVVDDHPTNRLVLKRQLNLLGYAVESAVDGDQAFAMYRAKRFAGVITDCNMPVMSGYELARRIRAHEAAHSLPRTPILACTANAMESEAAICTEAGMDDCVVKPAQLEALAQRLDHWVPLASMTEHPGLQGPRVADDLIDLALLDSLTSGNFQEQQKVLQEFSRHNGLDSDELRRRLFEIGDVAEAWHFAHRIRGSSAILGADAVTLSSEAVETACRAGDLHRAMASFQDLQGRLQQLDRYLALRWTISVAPQTRGSR